jgi:hypothetical protein
MKSVPPRGSGWVSDTHLCSYGSTRYREVVLTSPTREVILGANGLDVTFIPRGKKDSDETVGH